MKNKTKTGQSFAALYSSNASKRHSRSRFFSTIYYTATFWTGT